MPPQSVTAPRPSTAQWQLIADSAVDFPGGSDRNYWYYLFTDGRNNFNWREMGRSQGGPDGCYHDPGQWGLEICHDSIKANPRGDVGIQWKASRGGSYRFEWDSPALRFYKHATLVGSEGKGAELPYSASFEGVIDWELFFWVPDAPTGYHIKVFRFEE